MPRTQDTHDLESLRPVLPRTSLTQCKPPPNPPNRSFQTEHLHRPSIHESRSRVKIMGFWMSVANVRGIFGVKEDEQVGMSLKLGWKFCSNETTGYQARKEMACITVGDWRLRLIELRNRFERIIFFPYMNSCIAALSPSRRCKCDKTAQRSMSRGGERPTARVACTNSQRCRLNSRQRGRTSGFFIFGRLSNSNWNDRSIIWWGGRKVFGN